MSYGWLTESSFLPKKSKTIKIQDQSSMFGLKAIVLRQKQKTLQSDDKRKVFTVHRKQPKQTTNPGIEARIQKDQQYQKNQSSKIKDSNRSMQIKQKVYETLENNKKNIGKLLVDFQSKNNKNKDQQQYQKTREAFYSGKFQQIQQQREQLANTYVEERDVRQRLTWQKQILAELKGQILQKQKVQQVFDKRMKGDQRQALEDVLKQLTQQEQRKCDVKKRKQQLQEQRQKKLEKLNRINQLPQASDS